MNLSLKWRTALVLVVTGLGVFLCLPTFLGPNRLPGFFPKERLRLGLDLQGGMHLVLEVEAEKAVENELNRIAGDLKETAREQEIRTRNVTATGQEIHAVFHDSRTADQFSDLVTKEYPNLESVRRNQAEGETTLVFAYSKKETAAIERRAVEQAIETIRNRVDQFGVTEPTIAPEGDRDILIQLPGIKDPERAIALIGKTAQLEFHMVDDSANVDKAVSQGPSPGDEILYEHQVDPVTHRVVGRTPIVVEKRVAMTGDTITDARVQIDQQYNEPYVSMEFNSTGARLFERITGQNVGKRMAIVLDGVVQSAPVIRERIGGGRAQITGRFTMDEARDLAIALRSGSLPAPVKVLERRTVGPSLGADSIRSGLISAVIGSFFVFLFMFAYYKGTGFVADLALVANLILIGAVMSLFGATLTLPGIAGVALTVGMAVDANVLINERIREELRLGKSPLNAVEAGYHKAFSAILDSNLTTLIAAAALYAYGTGPIQGFAVTLSIGLLASMFTAIAGTRVVFDWHLHRGNVKRLSI